MKLFENGVGRPSNEIKTKRKIFIASVVSVFLAFFAGIFLLLSSDSTKLKGVVYLESDLGFSLHPTIYVEDYTTSQKSKKVSLKLNSWGTKVQQVGVVVCETLSDCTSEQAWEKAPKLSKGVISKVGASENLVFNTKNKNFQKYYLRVTTYLKKNNTKSAMRSVVLEIKPTKLISKSSSKKRKYTYSISSNNKYKKNYVTLKTTTTTTTKLNDGLKLTCPTNVYVGEVATCATNLEGVTITAPTTNKAVGGSTKFKTNSSIKQMTIRYEAATTITVMAKKDGYKTVSKKVNILKLPNKYKALPMLTLECPSQVKVGEEFTCISNQAYGTINATSANLHKSYKNSLNTSAGNTTIKLKYTKAGTVTVVSKWVDETITRTITIKK